MTRVELGRLLRSARAWSGLSLEDISRKSRLSPPVPLRLERGEWGSPADAREYAAVMGARERGLVKAIDETEWGSA